jgi:hypothetical protein
MRPCAGFPADNRAGDRLIYCMKGMEQINQEARRHWLELEMFLLWLDWYEARAEKEREAA